jgi:hypothetical protein
MACGGAAGRRAHTNRVEPPSGLCATHRSSQRCAQTDGRRHASVCGMAAYGGGPTWCSGRRRASGCVPAQFHFGLARFGQVYLKIFQLKCSEMFIPKL